MPVRQSSNNRILPPNSRNADVATKAIQEITPVQQQRNLNAHRVQGFQGLLYSRLDQGRKCSCQASEKHLATRLDEDGKAKPGVVNELLTGAMRFNVTPYGSSAMPRDNPFDTLTSPNAPMNKNQGVFDNVSHQIDNLPSTIVLEDAFGDNGPLSDLTIDDMVGDWDASHAGFTEAACAVCFGSGFIGGYAPFHAHRIVQTVNDVKLIESELDLLQKPWKATGLGFSFVAVLPYGAMGLDIFRVMNNTRPVVANFTIDGHAVNSVTVMAFCDGRPHTIAASFAKELSWTHVEIQFVTSSESAFFELPRLNKGSDISLLEQTEPFQVSMSSNIPNVQVQDLIVESTYGKVLIVQNSNWWNTRNRDVLGWDCQVRPVQPQELYNIMPKRGRVLTKQPSAVGVHDNQLGAART